MPDVERMNRQQVRDDLRRSLVPPGTRSDSSSDILRVGDGDDSEKQEKEYLRTLARRNLAMTLMCTSCMLMLYGYDFGITAWSVLLIKERGEDGLSDVYTYLATRGEALGLLVACAPTGGFIEGLIGSKVANPKGRKAEIQLVNVLCILGASLEAFAGLKEWLSVGYVLFFVIGRLTYGLGLGLSLRCGPMYLRETVTGPFKDIATVSVKLSMVVGVIVSYVVGGLLGNAMLGYFGVWLLAGCSLLCLQVLPESPMFMLLHEERFPRAQVLDALKFTNPYATEAHLVSLQKEILREVLSYTPGHPSFGGGLGRTRSGKSLGNSSAGANGESDECTSDSSDGLNTVKALVNTGTTMMPTSAVPLPIPVLGTRNGATDDGYDSLDDSQKRGSIAKSVEHLPSLTKAPGMLAALVLTAGLMVFEQASGMTAILYFGGVFLADIDIITVDWGLAMLGVLQLVVAVAVMYALNPVGRKPLLIYGLAGLLGSSLMLLIAGSLGMGSSGRWLGLIGLYTFTASYSTSLGALVWVLVSEVFPTCHRAQATSIVATAHFGTSAVMVVVLPLLQDVGGYAAMFACFFGVAILANLFANRFMVETTGLTSVQIQTALTKKAGFASKTGGYEAPVESARV
eukprot:g18382.t1